MVTNLDQEGIGRQAAALKVGHSTSGSEHEGQ